MENMNNKESENVCGCECHGGMNSAMMHSMHGMAMGGCGCHGGKNYLIKTILKLIIIIIIFWCGFKLGEITGSIRADGFGGRTMTIHRGGYDGMMNTGAFELNTDGAQALPATPVAPKGN